MPARKGYEDEFEGRGDSRGLQAAGRLSGRPEADQEKSGERRPMAPDELSVLTVCGVGMGSSLILRMTAEKVFAQLGLKAHVLATDVSSAMSMHPDIVIGQSMHTSEFQGKAPIVISVDNFLSEEELRTKLLVALEGLGWLAA